MLACVFLQCIAMNVCMRVRVFAAFVLQYIVPPDCLFIHFIWLLLLYVYTFFRSLNGQYFFPPCYWHLRTIYVRSRSIAFIGAVLPLFFLLYSPFLLLLCCVCLLNAVKLAASIYPIQLLCCRFVLGFYCISNMEIHSESICWLSATFCPANSWCSVKI